MRPAYPYESVRWGKWALVLLPVPAAAAFVWRDAWWPLVVLVLWTAAAVLVYVSSLKQIHRDQSERMLEHARLSAIRTLSHHRHDWMNDLQILYGYLRLNKPDKAVEIVDRIRERAEIDSRVSQLGNAELSAYLLSFRAVCDHLRLEVMIGDGIGPDLLHPYSDKLASCLIGLINAIRRRAVTPSAKENVLRLSMYRGDDTLNVELQFEGEWASGPSLAGEAERLLQDAGQTAEEEGTTSAPGNAWKLRMTFPTTA